MSNTDESAGMADTDINSTDPEGTNLPGRDDGSSAAFRVRVTTQTVATWTAATPSPSHATAPSTRPAATAPSTTPRQRRTVPSPTPSTEGRTTA